MDEADREALSLLDPQERALSARKHAERREWLKGFTLAVALILLTLAAASLLAQWDAGRAAS